MELSLPYFKSLPQLLQAGNIIKFALCTNYILFPCLLFECKRMLLTVLLKFQLDVFYLFIGSTCFGLRPSSGASNVLCKP